jgi:hypothetical protein
MYRSLCVLSVVLILGGCGKHGKNHFEAKADMAMSKTGTKLVLIDGSGSMNIADDLTKPIARMIVYTASIHLVVEEYEKFESRVKPLTEKYKGLVDSYSTDRTQGKWRSGKWSVRVPVADFDTLLGELEELGIPESKQIESEDVTREHKDIGARLIHDRASEKRILGFIAERTGKIEDVLKAEVELRRVRGDIESKEEKLRSLKYDSSYSTIHIHARQEKDYTPPAAPIFSEQITATWHSSLKGLQTFGKSAVLAIVGAAPWLAILAIVITPPVWLTKRRIRRRREATT